MDDDSVVIHYKGYILEALDYRTYGIQVDTDYSDLNLGEYLRCVDRLCEVAAKLGYLYVQLIMDTSEDFTDIVIAYFGRNKELEVHWEDDRYGTVRTLL